ncbi:ComEA family DNA-binding protein [Maribacter antarcticus]|uniref:ComEA family DNA-binding protein n=1 Tax=Maribacter antarcticus TaxID=505250 RepID=UPI0004788B7F|nr:helix-hairpin-helix domain-containing protein [Maribacter antarcticus]
MKSLKSHFKFNKQERSGIFFLLLLLILAQIGYVVFKDNIIVRAKVMVPDLETQQQIDILRQNATVKDTLKIYPFNPNFITDYKGYTLGLSLEEIDRLHAFRANNTYINSAQEFQQVTLVSDSLLDVISPLFKFPDWVTNKSTPFVQEAYINTSKEAKTATVISDLNTATEAELKLINGIGDKLAARIIKFRDRLGGFLLDDQLSDVYGLKPEVVERTLNRFRVLEIPLVKKMNINTATAEELAHLVYLQKSVAYDIVAYRGRNGGIDSFDELLEIEGFPTDRINRIALYLYLKN